MQIDRGRRESQSGLGIGLALVQTLVELHGGAVEAKSDGIGRGSEFLVRLPLARDDSGTESEPAQTLRPHFRSTAKRPDLSSSV